MKQSIYDSRSLTIQGRDGILKLIQDECLKPGDKLPSERQLSQRLTISRPTIREILQILEKEGRIIRQVGVGTFVRESTTIVDEGLAALVSYTEMMVRSGHKAGTSSLEVFEEVCSPEEASLFQVEAGDPKILLKRVRTMDDIPAQYCVHVSPKSFLGNLHDDEYQGSFFDLLERKSGLKMSYSDTHIYSTLAGKEIGKALGLSANTPLLVLDEIVYSMDNRVMCTSLTYYRGDIYRYHILRRRPGKES
jgi:GntR family transcriptional regulator